MTLVLQYIHERHFIIHRDLKVCTLTYTKIYTVIWLYRVFPISG